MIKCETCRKEFKTIQALGRHSHFTHGISIGGKVKRSLHQCLEAKCREDEIYCAKGHILGHTAGIPRATISIIRLERGEPLEMSACQNCPDYDEMGPPVPKSERGWVDLNPIKKETTNGIRQKGGISK